MVAVSPVRSPAAASTREPVHTEVVYGGVRWTPADPLEHPLVVLE